MTKTVTSSGTTAADSIRNVPLDLVADEVQHVLDARARQGQRGDGDDRDQRDDQGVLDQRLTLLGPHLRQVEPHRERLKHVALLSPLEDRFCSYSSCLRRCRHVETPAKVGRRPSLRRGFPTGGARTPTPCKPGYQTYFGPTVWSRRPTTMQSGSDQSTSVPRTSSARRPKAPGSSGRVSMTASRTRIDARRSEE